MKKNYLEKYFERKNEVKERLIINKKLLVLLLSFVICSLIYLFINIIKKDQLSGDLSASSTLGLYQTIMNITYIITIVGIIFVLLLYKNKINISYKTKLRLYNIFDWLIILPICVVLSSFFFNFVFSITEVSGNSMNPTILEGDELVLNYTNSYQRNDIVVINVTRKHNKNVFEDKYYLKRIVGLPGDELVIKIENGMTNIYINGSLYEQTYYKGNNKYQNFELSKYYDDYYQLSLDDKGKATFGYLDLNGNEQTTAIIPANFYFVLGDNRAVSNDSRQIGLIRKSDIVGVTKYRINNGLVFYWRKIT